MKKGLSIIGLACVMHAQGLMRPQFCLDVEAITDVDCDINPVGTELEIYYGQLKDFTTFPEPVTMTNATTLEEIGVTDTAPTPVVDKGFVKLAVELDQNSVQSEFQGTDGNGNFLNKGRFFMKGAYPKIMGFANQAARMRCCVLIPLKDGVIIQIGSPKNPAFIKPAFDSKTDKATDPRGWAFDVESYGPYAVTYESGLTIPQYT